MRWVGRQASETTAQRVETRTVLQGVSGSKGNEMLGAKVAGIGDRLPDLVLPTLDGPPTHLKEFVGTRLLLFVWASW